MDIEVKKMVVTVSRNIYTFLVILILMRQILKSYLIPWMVLFIFALLAVFLTSTFAMAFYFVPVITKQLEYRSFLTGGEASQDKEKGDQPAEVEQPAEIELVNFDQQMEE